MHEKGSLEILHNNEVSPKERFENFLHLLQKEYLDTLNKIDSLYPWQADKEKFFTNEEDERKNESRARNKAEHADVVSKIEEEVHCDIEGSLRYLDSKIPELAEKINTLMKEHDVSLDQTAFSLEDVLGNSIITGIDALANLLELKIMPQGSKFFEFDEEKRKHKIDLYTTLVKKFFADYWREGSDMRFYFDQLCKREDAQKKLEYELTTHAGYVEKFKPYININLTGGKKVPFFRFFCDLEDGLITTQEELNARINTLDPSGIDLNREKIKADFTAP